MPPFGIARVIENLAPVHSVTFVAPALVNEISDPRSSAGYAQAPADSSFPGSSADLYIKDSVKKSYSSFDEYITSVKGGLFSELFSKPAAYSVVQKDSPWPLRLELILRLCRPCLCCLKPRPSFIPLEAKAAEVSALRHRERASTRWSRRSLGKSIF